MKPQSHSECHDGMRWHPSLPLSPSLSLSLPLPLPLPLSLSLSLHSPLYSCVSVSMFSPHKGKSKPLTYWINSNREALGKRSSAWFSTQYGTTQRDRGRGLWSNRANRGWDETHTGTWRCHLEPNNGSSERCHGRTISGSTKNLSIQGSLKNHFLKEFFK